MADIKKLFESLSTIKELENETGPIVYYDGKPGFLGAYDAGLGFTFYYKDQGKDNEFELSPEELSTVFVDSVNTIPAGTPVVATYGWNGVLGKSFVFLYEFGYYIENGCVVYKQGECNMQDALAFRLDQIRIATPKDIKDHFWGN